MKKIAFLRVFGVHPFLTSLETMLRQSFPEFALETITLAAMLKQRKDLLALNALHMVKDYGREMLRDPGVFRQRFLRTPFMFRAGRDLVRARFAHNRADYAFTFQWQSLFDLSVPGVPHFVYTDHTYQESQRYAYRSAPYLPGWAALEGEIYDHADCVFTWSSNISRSLEVDYGLPRRKVVCAFTGSNVLPDSRFAGRREPANKQILFVGSDWERKGGPALAAAFEQVLKVHPDAQLTLVGPAPDTGLANIQRAGRVPIEAIGEYYRRAAIFCLPTRREPFGNAFIDALQYRLPVVATRVGATPDVVKDGENGYLVASGDIPALAAALIRLLDDAEMRHTFGERSFALWKSRYTWENVGCIMRASILPLVQPAPAD